MEEKEQIQQHEKQEEKNKNRKGWGILILLFLVVAISIGYAALSSNLNIGGSSKIKGQTWDVHFENISTPTKVGYCTDNGTGEFPAKINELTTTPSDKKDDQNISFSIGMKQPADKYTFTVQVKNSGTIDANVKLNVTQLTTPASNYLNWSVTGISTSSQGELLTAGSTKTVTVVVEYKSTVTQLPTSDITATLAATINATQA